MRRSRMAHIASTNFMANNHGSRWLRAVALAWACVLASAAPGLAQSPAEAVTGRVRPSDGRAPFSITLKRLNPPYEEWYMAGSDLADALQVGRFWRADVRKLVLRVDEQRITFTTGARAVVSDERSQMLRNPVVFHEGEPWIPLEFVTAVLPQLTSRSVTWDNDSYSMRLGVRQVNVTGVTFGQEDLATELRINLTHPLAFRVDDSAPRQLTVKVYGARLNPGDLRVPRSEGLVDSVQAMQQQDFALVVVQLSELVSRYQSLARDEGRTIVLRVLQDPITTIPEPVPRGPKLVQTLPTTDIGRKVQVRTVVIDPGHGGIDTGRQAANGLLEKDVNLAIALELKRQLDGQEGIEVLLTRDSDVTMGLMDRTEFANRSQGDLFISLHCNGWFSRSANGVETYFLSPAKSEWDAEVARRENQDVGAAEDIDFIVWDLVQNLYIQESATLAEAVQSRLSRDLDLRNRGVKQSGFRVLVGAYMPAILVEVGFLSNPNEAARLADNKFHRQIAVALRRAILDFRARMEAVREESP